MPTAAANITHVTYPSDERVQQIDQIKLHASKAAALEFAVDEGDTKYVPVRAGETIGQAIARYKAERDAAKTPRQPAGRPVADRPQA